MFRRRSSKLAFPPAGRRQRGIAAVEFAVILPILITLLTFPIFFGRVFLSYSVAQKAAHDAAIYLSGIPKSEMSEYGSASSAAAVAMGIATAELAELQPGGAFPVIVDVQCDGVTCGMGVPTDIAVTVRLQMFDSFFNNFTWETIGSEGIKLRATVTVPYVGA